MGNKSIVLVSRDDMLFKKLSFTLRLIDFDCTAVHNEKEGKEIKKLEPAAVFFDETTGYRPAVDLALGFKTSQRDRMDAPLFLLSHDREFKKRTGEYTVFDDFAVVPFLRQDIYKMLKEHRILENREIELMPFLTTLPEETIKNFLKELETSKEPVAPVYSGGYHYPLADEFFPGDARDSISILLNLFSQGILERKIFDRIHQCPFCGSVQVNFRECCPQCHSIDFSPVEMLHHFSCGYVGDSEEFHTDEAEDFLCPKCGKILRHIGMDYEKPISSYRCEDCRMHFSIPAVRCRCFSCGKDFPPADALIQTFYTYTLRTVYGSASATSANSSVSERKEPFSSSKETFAFLLRQDFGISKELGFPVQLIAVDGKVLRDAERHELLRMIHEFKRPVDVVYASPQGIILILLFYLTEKAVEDMVREFRKIRQDNPMIGKRNLEFRIHRFSGSENIDTEKILEKLCSDLAPFPEEQI